MTTERTWLDAIAELVAVGGGRGGFAVCLPEYRPDLVKAIAHRLQLRFYDYREEELRRHGANAYRVSLEELDDTLGGLAVQGGAMVLNVEALLAAKPEQDRTQWLADFMRADWASPMVLSLTLFTAELEGPSGRVMTLDKRELPEQSLVSRLLH